MHGSSFVAPHAQFTRLDKQKNGIYLLRQSNRDENKFILSLIKDGECFHYRAHHAGNGTFLDEKTDSIFYCTCKTRARSNSHAVFAVSSLGRAARILSHGRRSSPSLSADHGSSRPAIACLRSTTWSVHRAASGSDRRSARCHHITPRRSQLSRYSREKRRRFDALTDDRHYACLSFAGNTPLHEAAFFGRDDAVKVLLKAGANWKFVNKLGWTSLHVESQTLTSVPITPRVSFLASGLGQLPDRDRPLDHAKSGRSRYSQSIQPLRATSLCRCLQQRRVDRSTTRIASSYSKIAYSALCVDVDRARCPITTVNRRGRNTL